MRIILAGNTALVSREVFLLRAIRQRLQSYHYITPGAINYRPWLENIRHKEEGMNLDLFLDSGAFSAYTQGVEIDIDEYIAFIKKHQKILSVYANLDVIGDPDATMRNQKHMESKGLAPLPCFHRGEPFKYLQHYIQNYDYIAFGGLVGEKIDLSPLLDEMFAKYICDNKGLPRVKVHGFGLTSLRLMLRYPWYSVDSTSWVVLGSKLGSILVPRPWEEGLGEPWKVIVSNRNADKGREHIEGMGKLQRRAILDYLKSQDIPLGQSTFRDEEAGYLLKKNESPVGAISKGRLKHAQAVETIIEPGVINDYKWRDVANVKYYINLEARIPEWPWAFKIITKKTGFVL